MTFRAVPALAALATVLAVAWGCEQAEQVRDHFRDLTPHEAYLASLSGAGLTETALVKDWISSSLDAVAHPVPVDLPFQEEGFIAPEEAGAVAYRLHVGRGQRLTGEVTLSSGEGARVFVDLFRMPEDSTDALRPVLSMDSVPGTFRYEPWRGGDYILRVQPELLRGGRYRVTLHLEAQLAFPVQGKNDRAILSYWGQPRDGGRRRHEGVDIFARRGTPVLAPADGVVRRIQVTRLGGKVVWLRDPVRNASLYFAHLDSQAVEAGQRVKLGDVLGFVGNTGNARTTSPHLHFGIYRRGEGAVNPAPFLRQPRGTLAPLAADLARLGGWVRLSEKGIHLRQAPGLRTEVVRDLEQYTPARVLAGSGDWYRVRLPDGTAGYVAARLTEPADLPLGTRTAAAGTALLRGPDTAAPVVEELRGSAEVPVLGRYGDYLYVRAPTGGPAWMGAGS
ncbi:MAG: M23 family metallopeptidase [Gemmatimonadota bacterium]|jgi:murein DD-endopeptidase MepM/ murein hydrolase activator NlpD